MPRQACERTSSSGIVEEIWVLMVHCEAAPMRTNYEQLDIRHWKKISVRFLGFEEKIEGIKI